MNRFWENYKIPFEIDFPQNKSNLCDAKLAFCVEEEEMQREGEEEGGGEGRFWDGE